MSKNKDRVSSMLAGGETVTIPEDNGKGTITNNEYRLRPVVAQQLCDLENDALKFYKRSYLSTYADNVDLLGNGDGTQLLRDEMDRAAKWDLSDLPQKEAYDATSVPITDELKEKLTGIYGDIPDTDDGVRALVLDALDKRTLNREQVKELSGAYPIVGRVRYDQWWVTASMEGMVSFVTNSVRQCHPDITKKRVASWPFVKIAEAAHIVERLTTASMGNGLGSPD